jgi:hypothetical protein
VIPTRLAPLGLLLAGCAMGQGYGGDDADADVDTDTDTGTGTGTGTGTLTDTGMDLDADTDSDTDSDSDTDTGTGTGSGTSTDPCDEDGVPRDVEHDHVCTFGQGPFTRHQADVLERPELHVLGVYQSVAGEIAVELDRRGPAVLVLSSYEPVNWVVTASAGACLQRVILNGYNDQTAEVPDGVEVDEFTGYGYLAACAFEWPNDDGGCDTPGLVDGAEAETDLVLTSFGGCYESSGFTLSD